MANPQPISFLLASLLKQTLQAYATRQLFYRHTRKRSLRAEVKVRSFLLHQFRRCSTLPFAAEETQQLLPTFIEPRSVLKLSASAIPAIRRPSDPQRQVASPSQPAPFSRWGSTSESSAGRICTAVASLIAKYADHRVYNLLFTLVSGKSSHMSPELRRSIGDNHCAVAACISKAARLCGCTSAFV